MDSETQPAETLTDVKEISDVDAVQNGKASSIEKLNVEKGEDCTDEHQIVVQDDVTNSELSENRTTNNQLIVSAESIKCSENNSLKELKTETSILEETDGAQVPIDVSAIKETIDVSAIKEIKESKCNDTEKSEVDIEKHEDLESLSENTLKEEYNQEEPASKNEEIKALKNENVDIKSKEVEKTDVLEETNLTPERFETEMQIKQQSIENEKGKAKIQDSNEGIKEFENIQNLQIYQQKLIEKQQELELQIKEQQLLAQKLAAENKLQQQNLHLQQQTLQQQENIKEVEVSSVKSTKEKESYNSSSYIDTRNESAHTNETLRTDDTSNAAKVIDLTKIFTPANDAAEIIPKNRKMFASSAFYSSSLHPTVEDQVELARKISHSLSDTNNQTSKGQSMYVNRKKRSVKWIHEGCRQAGIAETLKNDEETEHLSTELEKVENAENNTLKHVPLKLLMNPRGQVLHINSKHVLLNTETGLLSPQNCAELLAALQMQKSKGSELFAKRRRKADDWIVGESNAGTQNTSGFPDNRHHHFKPPTSPTMVPAYSDAGKHRVQLNMHQEQVLEKYSKPNLKVIKTPWEAALETGSASAAFVDEQDHYTTSSNIHSGPEPLYCNNNYESPAIHTENVVPIIESMPTRKLNTSNSEHSGRNYQRDLAYKPNLAQGWNVPIVGLPKELYIPKEIPIKSYNKPPSPNFNILSSQNNSSRGFPRSQDRNSLSSNLNDYQSFHLNQKTNSVQGCSIKNQNLADVTQSRSYGIPTQQTQKDLNWKLDSYQKEQQISQKGAQMNFTPSPISYQKLAKYENANPHINMNNKTNKLQVNVSKVRNNSPTPFHKATKHEPLCSFPIVSKTSCVNKENPFPQQYNVTRNYLRNSNFNKLAQGWKEGHPNNIYCENNDSYSQSSIQMSGSLPYTDF